ncbi:MAG: SDR family NAD(P)-dependent oxidoreductase [Spirochaetota bacterium]
MVRELLTVWMGGVIFTIMAIRKDELRDQWAVVTGASSGLGRDFALQLAGLGMHVVVAARRADRLEELKREIEGRFGARVLPVQADLAGDDGAERLYQAVAAEAVEPLVLVNNAGFGAWGPFLGIPWEKERSMLELDIVSLVYLTRRFAADMVARGRGYILQVSSIGAYQSAPTYASYAAAKSFVLHHGEAIGYELRGTGVSVTVLSPGVTATDFLAVAGQQPTAYQRLAMMESERVVRVGIRAMLRRRMSVVPGFLNAFTVWLNRLLPRRLIVRIAEASMRQPGSRRAAANDVTLGSPTAR